MTNTVPTIKVEGKVRGILYLAFDIGCIECGEKSSVIGVYSTEVEAERAIKKYITNEPNKFGTNWGRKEWRGQHSCEVFKVKVNNSDAKQ